jgi:hypothetical protein
MVFVWHEKWKVKVYNHMAKHMVRIHKHMVRVHKHAEHTSHIFFHLWELIVVWLLCFFWLMHAWSTNLPNNTSFSYPLQKVSTLECRTLYWEDMPDSCKINLPIIHGANYSSYAWNSLYRSIYTTLWAAPYSDTWNQIDWAHAWIDVATARGTPIYSIWNWVVFYAWWNSSYGNVIKVKYIYKWEIVYAVYAHLDTIEVNAWDSVVRWQKIWTTWNSWNTFGALWWYHLHFEIDKDNGWRPAYSYTNCEDVSKWHYTIIQNWLCRAELFKYQYDPIRVLEWVATPSLEQISHVQVIDVEDLSTWNNIILSETEDKNGENENKDENNVEEVHWSQETQVIDDDTNNKENIQEKIETKENNSVVDNNVNEDENKDKTENSNESDVQNNNQWNTSVVSQDTDKTNVPDTNNIWDNGQKQNDETTNPVENNPEKDPLIIDLDYSKLNKNSMAYHFLTQWDVEMKSSLNKYYLPLWATKTIDIEVFKKWKYDSRDWNYLNWVLQVPFEFIGNNDGIGLNINTLQLLSQWKAKIEVTWLKKWSSAIVIKLWWEKIWVLNVNVQ